MRPLLLLERVGKLDPGRLLKAGINLAGSVAGVGTGAILTTAGGAAVLAIEPTGISKVAGAITTTTGLAMLADSAYGVYSNTVNLYRAVQGSYVYLPDSGSGKLATWLVPNSQEAQDIAQIASLSLALAAGKVYVGTTPRYVDSAYAQYMPATIGGMLDAKKVTNPSVVSGLLIPNTNPGKSTASWFLDTTQILQAGSINFNNVVRITNEIQGKK